MSKLSKPGLFDFFRRRWPRKVRDEGPSLSEWMAERYPQRLSEGEDLVCGCPRSGPSRPGCPIHGSGPPAPRQFLFSRDL